MVDYILTGRSYIGRAPVIVVYSMNRRVFLLHGTETVETCQVVFRKG
jgi:hypothetical protein